MKKFAMFLFFPMILGLADTAAQVLDADDVRRAGGVNGGVVVHVGCGNGRLISALMNTGSYTVQGLDVDAQTLARVRERLRAKVRVGKLSLFQFDNEHLPYIDNLVNLVIADAQTQVADAEIVRVLAPGGVFLAGEGGGKIDDGERQMAGLERLDDFKGMEVFRKPVPEAADEWTHYLHTPDNNAVAQDDLIQPPAHLQWIGAPRYGRHHDHMSSISAMVSAAGRNFYICDEGSPASILLPSKWKLVGRDAYNGTVLWKRNIEKWHSRLWPLKSGPQMLARRLVARDETVYATLAIDGPLSALDAATGETTRTYENTRAAEEVFLDDGILYVVVAQPETIRSHAAAAAGSVEEIKSVHRLQSWGPERRAVMAVDAETGRTLWTQEAAVTPMTLALGDDKLFFQDGEKVVCLDRRVGTPLWASKPVPLPEMMQSQGAAVLVVSNGVVLFGGYAVGEKDRKGRGLIALSADDGSSLWESNIAATYQTLRDLFVIDGIVWNAAVHKGGNSPGTITGRELHTGKIKSEFPADADTHWFHHRCYRGKATRNYLLFSRTGIEFVDFRKSHWIPHHWVRGGCSYGIMPANGMIYSPPHPCACYSDAKLYGFNALAPERKNPHPHGLSGIPRLVRGPAFGKFTARLETANTDWPTYRRDNNRSGFTPLTVPAKGLENVWKIHLGGKLTPLSAAAGKIFLASPDTHTVYALDAKTGRTAWAYTAGGRIDSPPTIWQGRALFGSRDGYVYCLRASDGLLVWRFRAAPFDRQLGAFNQLESVWPVHGSVLVQDDVLYCVAGRSMFIDGGLRMILLDPGTGEVISENIMDDRDPATGRNMQMHIDRLNMAPALSDLLSSDGKYVYMRTQVFDMRGKRKSVGHVDVEDLEGDDLHLFSPTGFLDASMWHRTYWVYGRAWGSGCNFYYKAGWFTPSGRLLVFDDSKVYGYGRLPELYRWTTPLENRLFAMDKTPEILEPTVPKGLSKKERKALRGSITPKVIWENRIPVQVFAMTLTGDNIFLVGPTDVLDEMQAVAALKERRINESISKQEAAFRGNRGSVLRAVSAVNGNTIAEYRLQSLPVFDGMIAANHCLYLTGSDGTVECLAPRKP